MFTQLLNGLLRGWAGWKRLEQIERTRHSLPPAPDFFVDAEVIPGELLRFAVGHGKLITNDIRQEEQFNRGGAEKRYVTTEARRHRGIQSLRIKSFVN